VGQSTGKEIRAQSRKGEGVKQEREKKGEKEGNYTREGGKKRQRKVIGSGRREVDTSRGSGG